MTSHKHPHTTLIERVGNEIVRQRFSLTPQSLYNWSTRGIPETKRVRFAKMAAEYGVAVPEDFFGPVETERAA